MCGVLDPDNETAWINLGNVHLDMEAAEAAVDAYTRALAAAPRRSDTLRLLGNALARAGRDAEAIDRLDAAVAGGSGRGVCVTGRARITRPGPPRSGAGGPRRRAGRVAPRRRTASDQGANAALLWACQEAAALLRELLAAAPDNADVHLSLATLWPRNSASGERALPRAVALRPDDQQRAILLEPAQ